MCVCRWREGFGGLNLACDPEPQLPQKSGEAARSGLSLSTSQRSSEEHVGVSSTCVEEQGKKRGINSGSLSARFEGAVNSLIGLVMFSSSSGCSTVAVSIPDACSLARCCG